MRGMATTEDRYHQTLLGDDSAAQVIAGSHRLKVGAALLAGFSLGIVFFVTLHASASTSAVASFQSYGAAEPTKLAGGTPTSLRRFASGQGLRPHPLLPSFGVKAPSRPVSARAEGSKYTLCYFDIRGVAETSRMLFAISKTPFEDKRFELKWGTPGDFKSIQRPEFDAAKAAGDLDANLGKVPYLEVDGKKIGQSKAIERYLAKQFGFLGSNDLDAAIIDALTEHVNDFKTAWQRVRGFGPIESEEKKAAIQKFFAEDLPKNMQLFEKSLPQCEAGPFLVGSQVSLADIILYQFCAAPGGNFDNQFNSNLDATKASFQDCPRIKKAMDAVAGIPELQVYITSRPERGF